MNSACTVDTSAGGPDGRSRFRKVVDALSTHWPYIGFAIFLATLTILLGIVTLSYVHPKKEGLIFGILCLSILLSLGHFASLCYIIQRAKHESSDPALIDAVIASGVVLLFAISGTVLTVELPRRCFSGPNEDLKDLGRGCCSAITTMAVSSWLAMLTMIVATVITFVAARRAIEFAKLPPPVFPSGAEAPVMRWLDRNDPFRSVSERRQQYA
ncbi:hypothetical protein HYPSUDRAFT_202133 [Hypholoma sublateritium FD-334 SS-4]|uniref:MARVEL domain-containing protein n=1 Tax=Hypholoma sublateritium (strain FD-334 SS-4) TaxID=945553 RepID=A0A0D2P1H9_HYPSF|nr:hypothetical protein HYPSUDRAFT_202133 [Hypholoma sublateritium FD-334 SS-4]